MELTGGRGALLFTLLPEISSNYRLACACHSTTQEVLLCFSPSPRVQQAHSHVVLLIIINRSQVRSLRHVPDRILFVVRSIM